MGREKQTSLFGMVAADYDPSGTNHAYCCLTDKMVRIIGFLPVFWFLYWPKVKVSVLTLQKRFFSCMNDVCHTVVPILIRFGMDFHFTLALGWLYFGHYRVQIRRGSFCKHWVRSEAHIVSSFFLSRFDCLLIISRVLKFLSAYTIFIFCVGVSYPMIG